ncbi:hypothetical protein [Azospirillum sp. Sh1]|uniref:DUF4376 domain-containing protein n=1 Tax=Azospirillum sp. Sh1 TaxID=2607285 RepID=UPI0011EF1845|nr:hypothetical protein [Azospirillum sp. Sh1]KAA0571065.1 hypothetical protein FZ029_27825 [Azospirillum sp. Sh1]
MDLPVLVVLPDGSRRLFERPEPFSCERTLRAKRPQIEKTLVKEDYEEPDTGEIGVRDVEVETATLVEVDEVDTITHPAGAWASYTIEEFEAACPGWTFLPVREQAAFDRSKVLVTRKPIADWVLHPDHAEVTYDVAALPQAETRAAKVRAIDVERDRRLALGALHGGKRFSMSDASRTDLGGMATTAGLVLSGALPVWPDAYVQGWIALDNSRLPLPAPADGVALAASVALAYSELVQHARDLKDAALAADDPSLVDEMSGWPDDDPP